jgi:putative selenium metabolism hydrolase
MTEINYESLFKQAKKLEPSMIKFLQDLISIPATSGNEEKRIRRIELEMHKTGFDEVSIDSVGNIIGKIGSGKTVILMDAHIDSVDTGDLNEWARNPQEGILDNGIIYGRGASDQLAGMVSLVYAVQLIKHFNLLDDYTLYITGTCLEEDCEGLAMFNIIRDENLIQPDFVVLSEPTNLKICRGHPGRIEFKITAKGKASHSSRPDLGINAIYLMQPVIEAIEALNNSLMVDPFLGKGTVAVTKIECQTPALCAIPNECCIYVDRRLTTGETKEMAFRQLEDIIETRGTPDATTLEILHYAASCWTGKETSMDKYFPGWVIAEDHPLTSAAIKAAEFTLNRPPEIGKWAFSTNGIATMGTYSIPTIGFGPANDIYAHTIDDQVPVDHLLIAAIFYAILPEMLVNKK